MKLLKPGHFPIQLPTPKALKNTSEVLPKKKWTIVRIILWYILSTLYNVSNKKSVDMLNGAPITVATFHMISCSIFVIVNRIRSIGLKNTLNSLEACNGFFIISKPSIFHAVSHMLAVSALSTGTLTFTQLVRASEPLFNGILLQLQNKKSNTSSLSPGAVASVFPLLLGGFLVSASESRVPWSCIALGALSNTFSAARDISIQSPVPYNVSTSVTSYVLLTTQVIPNNHTYSNEVSTISWKNDMLGSLMIGSVIFLLPLAILLEGWKLFKNMFFHPNLSIRLKYRWGPLYAMISGMLLYMYTRLSNTVLNEVQPATRVVAGALRRVLVVAFSAIIFRRRVSSQSIDWTDVADVFALLADVED